MSSDFDKIVKDLKTKNAKTKERSSELKDQEIIIQSLDALQNAVIKSIGVLINSLLSDTLTVNVANHQDQRDSINWEEVW